MGAVAAVFLAEYIIHLPLFNVLLGFPIQLLGLAMVPVRPQLPIIFFTYCSYFREREPEKSESRHLRRSCSGPP